MAADKISLQKLCDELESGIKVEEDIKFCKRLGPRSENSRILQIGFKAGVDIFPFTRDPKSRNKMYLFQKVRKEIAEPTVAQADLGGSNTMM